MFELIPVEISKEIFNYLNKDERKKIRLVSKKFRTLLTCLYTYYPKRAKIYNLIYDSFDSDKTSWYENYGKYLHNKYFGKDNENPDSVDLYMLGLKKQGIEYLKKNRGELFEELNNSVDINITEENPMDTVIDIQQGKLGDNKRKLDMVISLWEIEGENRERN